MRLLALLLLLPVMAMSATAEQSSASLRWLELGKQRYAARDYNGAVQAFDYARRWDPSNGKALVGLAYAKRALGDDAQYQFYMQQAQRIGAAPAMQSPAPPLAQGAPVAQAQPTVGDAGPGPWGALWRSALLPGWGQAASGHTTRAWIVGGGTWALFGAGWATYFSGEAAANKYLGLPAGTSQAQFDQAYDAWVQGASLNHGIVYTFVGAYTYNLIDAYLAGESPLHSAGLQVRPTLVGSSSPGLLLTANF